MIEILEGLNPAQKEAVEAEGGPLLILAGPGSGKTRVIAHRIAYLIKVRGVSPHRIMAVTFTNKAAREMKERVHRLLGSVVENITMGTFHAICVRILRTEAEAAGLDKSFAIYDDSDQMTLVKRAIQDVGLDPKQYAPRALLNAISSAKSELIAPEAYAGKTTSYFGEIVQRVYQRYQELLAGSKALDFDDLIMRTVQLFRNNPDVLARYQSRYLHLLVDEFQDTNVAQYVLARLLAEKHRNICVVGDPDQSIYSWRSADLRNIMYFDRDYPDARTVYLEQNYRSTKTILEAADHVISANRERKQKRLWTLNERGAPLAVIEAYNEQDEAQFVVSEVERLVSQGLYRFGDFAVMYRVNAQSRALEETFLRYGMPHKLVGTTRFYERREVKDALAYLRLIANPYDNVSFLRVVNVPPRGIGQRSLEELMRYTKELNMPLYSGVQLLADPETAGTLPIVARTARALLDFLSVLNDLIARGGEMDIVEFFDLVMEKTGYKQYIQSGEAGEDRWENILELRTVAREYDYLEPREALTSLLENVALVSDQDTLDEKVNAVTLITLHAAKGLEFPVVFIVGMEEGLLPHMRSYDDPAQMEEERRLAFVGMTRAKERLYLVRAFRRTFLGSNAPNPPSRFLKDIPRRLTTSPTKQALERATASSAHTTTRGRPSTVECDLGAGDRVRHGKFGEGIVVSCFPANGDYEVTVAFKGENVIRKLLLSFAPLERIKGNPA
ncbi:MAG: UvrD-helicase domain-containing protein [Chloroflexi bacterium]|nr:UvrD-helicase domain-containing protein [Chloroflexota bacterium]